MRARRSPLERVAVTLVAAFAAACLALQGVLMATASRRDDGAFGLRLFRESTRVHVRLARHVSGPGASDDVAVPVDGGRWVARDRAGTPRQLDWRDRVREPTLAAFDRYVDANEGARARLARLQAALDDVALHTPDDAETRRLVADVTLIRNGREPYTVRLTSVAR